MICALALALALAQLRDTGQVTSPSEPQTVYLENTDEAGTFRTSLQIPWARTHLAAPR